MILGVWWCWSGCGCCCCCRRCYSCSCSSFMLLLVPHPSLSWMNARCTWNVHVHALWKWLWNLKPLHLGCPTPSQSTMAVPATFDEAGAAEWAEGGMRDWSTQLALVWGLGWRLGFGKSFFDPRGRFASRATKISLVKLATENRTWSPRR